LEDALKSEVSISGNFLKGLLALLMPTDQVIDNFFFKNIIF
jgi:hypothetical protein